MAQTTVKDLYEKFQWNHICGDNESLNREIQIADTNRPGFELAGYYENAQKKRLIVLGSKEMKYIENVMDEVAQRRTFEFIMGEETPAILITNQLECPEILKEIADRKNFPVFQTLSDTTHAIVNVTNYLDEQLADAVVLHGNLMRIFGVGVMLLADSGMGKSEIALELIKKGHQLVADDRIDCYRIHNTLIGKTPHLLDGFMELRGVGVINIARMYGVQAYAHESRIDFQIVLEPFDDSVNYDRIGIEEREYEDILGVKILRMRIPVSMGRPMSTIIETAVTNYLLISNGKDPAKEFEENVLKQIRKNKEDEDEAV